MVSEEGLPGIATGKLNMKKPQSRVLYCQNPKFNLISTGRPSRKTAYFFEEHMKRLQESSRYFDYPFNAEKAHYQVEAQNNH